MTDQSTTQLLIGLERRLHSTDARSNAKLLHQLLDDSFVEFGASGKTFNKQQIIASLAEEPGLDIQVSSEVVTSLAPDVSLLTYTCTNKAPGKERVSIRSSVWKKINGQWKMIFHQGTIVFDPQSLDGA